VGLFSKKIKGINTPWGSASISKGDAPVADLVKGKVYVCGKPAGGNCDICPSKSGCDRSIYKVCCDSRGKLTAYKV
jgi:hypothetical protein